jgi:hypothetical protein
MIQLQDKSKSSVGMEKGKIRARVGMDKLYNLLMSNFAMKIIRYYHIQEKEA